MTRVHFLKSVRLWVPASYGILTLKMVLGSSKILQNYIIGVVILVEIQTLVRMSVKHKKLGFNLASLARTCSRRELSPQTQIILVPNLSA